MASFETVSRPTGTVTFLFTDIVRSTRLWERHPSTMEVALAWHDDLISCAAAGSGGYTFNHSGDSWIVAFSNPMRAVACALDLRDQLDGARALYGIPLSVRMVIDTAVVQDRDGDYFGPPLSRAARILGHTKGGEILMSASAAGLIRHGLDPSVGLIDLGEYKLRGLTGWEHLFRLDHGRRRHTGWRLLIQHSAWVALVFTVAAIVWMAIAWPPAVSPETETALAGSTTQPFDENPAARTATVSWTSEAGMGRALVANGRVLAGGPTSTLRSLDLATGVERWSVDLPGEVVGMPVAEGGNVFVVDDQTGKLTGVTGTEAALVFSCATGSTVVSPPAAGSGRVFVATTETPQVWAFDARPTSPERCQVDSAKTAIRAFGGIAVPMTTHGHTLLVVDPQGILHAFNVEDLASGPIWRFDAPHSSGTDFSSYSDVEVTEPVVLDVVFANRGGTTASRPMVVVGEKRVRNTDEGWRLLVIDLHTGNESLDPMTVGGPPGAGLGRMWVANTDRTGLLVLDHAGTVEHVVPVAMSGLAPLVDVDADRVYVVGPGEMITAVNAVNLSIEWQREFDGTITHLASGRGMLLVQDEDGRITALRPSRG